MQHDAPNAFAHGLEVSISVEMVLLPLPVAVALVRLLVPIERSVAERVQNTSGALAPTVL